VAQVTLIHFNELYYKLGIKLHLREDGLCVLSRRSWEGVWKLRSILQMLQTETCQQTRWMERLSQGRIARANYIDSSLSSSRMVNFRLSDSLIKFILKARLQLLERNRFLHTHYPGNTQRDARGAVFTLTLLATHWTVEGRAKTRFRNFSTLASVVVENVRLISPCNDLGRPDCPVVILWK